MKNRNYTPLNPLFLEGKVCRDGLCEAYPSFLIYHRLQRCLVTVKLKIGRFKPEYERRNNNQIKQC